MVNKVSVIINTLNRSYWLKRVLDSLLLQTYDDFEIIVVNGPSVDNTDEVLLAYNDIIKIEKCEIPNISVSRNIGIKAAVGEIIIFIDDDAVPLDKYWIENYVKAFREDVKLGCIGGKVLDNKGSYQFDSGTINIWGHSSTPYNKNPCNEHSEIFNQMMGCNMALLKKAVVEIGGFDEYFEYYLDESDLAVRLSRAGYIVSHHPYAHVYHESAKTHENKSRFHLNWYNLVKNQVYFGYKNSEGLYDYKTCKINILEEANNFKKNFKYLLKNRSITKNDYKQFIDMWEKGVEKGEYDGINTSRQLRFDLEYNEEFMKIDKTKFSKRMNVCFILGESINNNGGIAKYTIELAKGLFELDVNIHIIYFDNENKSYLKNGINFHSIQEASPYLLLNVLEAYPLSSNLLNCSYKIYIKVLTLIKMYNIQIIETPLWSFSGLLCSEFLDIPVITRLQTPAKIVNKVHEYEEKDDNMLYYEFERCLLDNSSSVISISNCIEKTISDSYDVKLNNISLNYLGIEDIEFPSVKHSDDKIIVFFIGRLERRKGIANILEVIPNIISKYKNVEFRLAGADVHDKILRTTFKKYFRKKYKYLLSKVSFLGIISDEQKEQELEKCDVFISPSLYESFGIIFIEAMRHKKPVIGCNTGGMMEVVDNGITGLLCEPNNNNGLEEALCTLIENKEKRKTMGQKGYERFKKMFTREKMTRGTLEIYKKVIEKHQRKQV